mgnify:CR=1 FL=1
MKMKGKSPLMKELVGKQENLNEGLKAAIKAAPGKVMKDSPMNMKMETAMKMGMVSPMKIVGQDNTERAKLKTETAFAKAKGGLGLDADSELSRSIMQEKGVDTGYRGEMKKVDPVKKEAKRNIPEEISLPSKGKDITMSRADIAASNEAYLRLFPESPEAKAMSKQEKKDLRQAKRSSKFDKFVKHLSKVQKTIDRGRGKRADIGKLASDYKPESKNKSGSKIVEASKGT